MPRAASAPPPPFCPNPSCKYHRNPKGWRFKKKGFYEREARPRRIQRYRCPHCRRSFSSQTFSTTYWLRRPELLSTIFHRVLACSAYRQIASELDVSHTTVLGQAQRLGRHCLLFQERHGPKGPPKEPLALDGFRSFEAGQYWPFDANLLVGASHFVYGFNEAELRRSGTLTKGQRRKREKLEERHGRPDPQATRKAVEELVGRVVPGGSRAELWSDQHPAYPRALARLRGRRIQHSTVSSRQSRTARNPLFPVNLADLLLRHTGAHHKRETIAFSKRRQGAMYRLAIWQVWRNWLKWTSERRRERTPAQALGLVGRRLRVRDVLAERLFPSRLGLAPWVARCYAGAIPTRCLPQGRRFDAKLAF